MILSAADLAACRSVAAMVRTLSAAVYDTVFSADGIGGQEEIAHLKGTYPIRLDSLTHAQLLTWADELGELDGFNAVFPWDADVKPKDYFLAGGDRFEVLGANRSQTEAVTLRAICGRVA